jgi:signal transduction histidine kinase
LERHTDKVSIGICLNALGEVYVSKNEFEKAYDNFSKELAIQKTLKNDNGICLAYLNMAKSLSKMNMVNKGEIHKLLKESEILLPTIKKNSDILLEIYYKFAEAYERIEDPKNALTYYKLYFSLNNTLLNKDKVQQFFELQTRYDTEKKENQIKLLQQSDTIKTLEISGQDEQIKARNITIVLIVISLFFILFYFYNYFQRQQLKSRLEKEQTIKATEEKERMRMAKDIHDDLGSGLSKIRFLSEIVFRKSTNDEELSNASSGISETASHLVENMRDLIWALNPENTTLANLTARIREYSHDYLEEFGAEVLIKFPENIPNSSISKEFHREIFMVVKECLNNIVKHSRASTVNIILAINSNEFQLTIIDNGIGIPANRSDDGNGLKNIKNRIESICGKVVIDSSEHKGTLIQFTVPFDKNIF